MDRVRSLTADLQQVLAGLSTARSGHTAGASDASTGNGRSAGAAAGSDDSSDEIIDADFERA